MAGKKKKFAALLLSVLVMSMSFSFAALLGMQQVKAQEQWVCCVKPNECNDNVIRSKCIEEGGTPYSRACSEVPECKVGACIPKVTNLGIHELLTSDCQYGKARTECEATGGAWSGTIPDACKKGCCQIPNSVIGRVCMNLPLFVCKEASRRDGGNYTFKEGTSSDECYNICGAEKLGCCVLGGGDCKYGTRGECKGTFYEGLYCHQVGSPQCVVEHHAYESCCSPLTAGGREIKRAICSFDSAGNQEETLRECPYPEAKCEICNKESCEDINGTNVSFGKPYCFDRSCKIENASGSQELIKDEEGITLNIKSPPSKLLHGQSICYNFFTYATRKHHNIAEIKLEETGATGIERTREIEMSGLGGGKYLSEGRQTGLQNEILRCFEGKVSIDALGVDREKLCVQISPVSVKTVENKWEECRQCAPKAGFWNTIQDAFLAVPGGLLRAIFLLKPIGAHCKAEDCEKVSVWADGIKVPMCWYNKDSKWSLFEEGIGSCDPIYPPGRTISENETKECGGGGDWLYNVCDESECISLGNLQTEKLGWIKTGISYLSRFISAFIAYRVSVVPGADCVGEAGWKCHKECAGPHYLACMPACFPKVYAWCLTDRTKYINPLCWASAAIGNAVSGSALGKWISLITAISAAGLPLPGWFKWITGAAGVIGALRGEETKEKETTKEKKPKGRTKEGWWEPGEVGPQGAPT